MRSCPRRSASSKMIPEEGEDEEVVEKLIKGAVLQTFREHCPPETLGQVVGGFEDGKVVHAGPDVASKDYVRILEEIPALRTPVKVLSPDSDTPAAVASALELVLEGLHLSKRLNKESAGSRATYRAREARGGDLPVLALGRDTRRLRS